MPDKVKLITPESKLSLRDLDISPGDFVGFDNPHARPLPPFIFAIVGEEGLKKIGNSRLLELVHSLPDEEERFYLHLQGGTFLQLCSPYHMNGEERFRMPDIQVVSTFDQKQSYNVGYAYVGARMVIRGLKERADIGLDVYSNWLESEKTRIERLGKMVEW